MTDIVVKLLIPERVPAPYPEGWHEVVDPIKREAAEEIERLRKALDLYERERERFRHNAPEITGAYFLAGGHGEKDANQLPQYVRIVPAYGCAFEVVYQKTEKVISYEGS